MRSCSMLAINVVAPEDMISSIVTQTYCIRLSSCFRRLMIADPMAANGRGDCGWLSIGHPLENM